MSSSSSGSSGGRGGGSALGGSSWPPALRRRLGIPPSATTTKSIATKSTNSDDSDSSDIEMPLNTSSLLSTTNYSQQLSSHELRKYIHSSYHALTSIQRQLHRGEESYFEQSYARGNILMGWDNIWMEQQSSSSSSHANNKNNNSGGHGGELDAATSNDVNNNYPSNKHPTAAAKSTITMRRMPNDYRWFTASCHTNLPITASADNSNNAGGRILALERNSLIDRCPTPEVQEEIVEIAVKEEEGGGGDVNNNVKKEEIEKDDKGSVAIESSSALSMEGTKEGEVIVGKSNKVGGKDVESAADMNMEIDESTVLASNKDKKESSDTTQEQSMEIDSSTTQQQLSSKDEPLKKENANEPNEEPSSTNENVSTAETERSSTLSNDNASSDFMLPAKGGNSAPSLSNGEEPSLSPTLSATNQQTNETKKTSNESPPSNTTKKGGTDYYAQWPSDMAIASPAADTNANQMGKDESGGIAVDSGKNTANHKEEPVAIDDKDGSNNALGTAAVDQPPPPYSSKRARHQTKDDDDIGDDRIDEEKTEDSDGDKPKSGSNAHPPTVEGSPSNVVTMNAKSSDIVDQGGDNCDAGESNNTQSKQQFEKEEKVAASTVAAATDSGSRTTSRRSTRKRKAAS